MCNRLEGLRGLWKGFEGETRGGEVEVVESSPRVREFQEYRTEAWGLGKPHRRRRPTTRSRPRFSEWGARCAGPHHRLFTGRNRGARAAWTGRDRPGLTWRVDGHSIHRIPRESISRGLARTQDGASSGTSSRCRDGGCHPLQVSMHIHLLTIPKENRSRLWSQDICAFKRSYF